MRAQRWKITSLAVAAAVVGALLAPSVGAADDRVRGSYLVALARGVSAAEASDVARDHGGRAAHVYDGLGSFAFSGPDAAHSALARDPRVRSVEADRLVRATTAPPIPDLTHLERTKSYDAFTAGYTGLGVSIAIIDTGVQAGHKVFHPGQVVSGKSCVGGGTKDQEGHGTASASNAAGRAGVAHDATIVPVKVFRGASLSTPISKVVCGLNWVKKQNDNDPGTPIDVVNLSLAFSGGSGALKNAVDGVRNSGAVVVAAAGNNGGKTQAPARYPSVIAVSALAGGTKMASFSASGGDMTAPGVNIKGAENGGGFSRRSGTSRSSPMVAGGAAIALGEDPTLTPGQVFDVLRMSGQCPDGSINGGTGFCSGRWKGDDASAEPLLHAYCVGVAANPVDTNLVTCGF